jgi:maleylpyruvate isomerase
MPEADDAVLFGYFRSTAAYRVRIALGLKGLGAQHRFVHLRRGEQTQEAYRSINPAGLVPYWIDSDLHLAQSLAIIEYLDETHPNPPLLPKGAQARAIIREMAQVVCCDIHPVGNLRVLNRLTELGVDDAARTKWSQHWIERGFDAIGTHGVRLAADAGRHLHRAAGLQCAPFRRRSVTLSPHP